MDIVLEELEKRRKSAEEINIGAGRPYWDSEEFRKIDCLLVARKNQLSHREIAVAKKN